MYSVFTNKNWIQEIRSLQAYENQMLFCETVSYIQACVKELF